MKRILATSFVALMAAFTANATIIETEPNNTPGSANAITRGPVIWADAGILSLGAAGNDVDYLTIDLNQGEILTAITTPLDNLPVNFNDPDTLLALFALGGAEVVFNDDANGLGSAIRYLVPATGRYTVAITGFGDRNFDGQLDSNPANGHGEDGLYVLTASIVVPEPASLSLLAVGALAFFGRRKA